MHTCSTKNLFLLRPTLFLYPDYEIMYISGLEVICTELKNLADKTGKTGKAVSATVYIFGAIALECWPQKRVWAISVEYQTAGGPCT